jgi:uncharacterized repeat protein (TIGR03803 family)
VQPKRPFDRSRAVAVTFTVVLFLTSAWAGDHETVLYNFYGDPHDGGGGAVLIRDAAGNLYGTGGGGIYRCGTFSLCGTVFELSRVAGGGWTETVLHNFGNGTDGAYPNNLIRDAAGNLYGTTVDGGLYGFGIVYELSPAAGGDWTETVLYNFGNGDVDSGADGPLFLDAAGNLYGATFHGGAYRAGSVYKLSPSGGGDWTETVLHNFGNGTDGALPNGGLVVDGVGNVYGTTGSGGIYTCNGLVHSCGTAFELSPSQGGGWTETVLHSFSGSDGLEPQTGLTMDAAGNFYGTTAEGGAPTCNCGNVFEVSPGESGGWTFTVLYSFNNLPDAQGSVASLTIDSAGNLYDASYQGGAYDYGAVFQLSHTAGGWTETVLYSFDSLDSGIGASSGVVLDRAGDMYGSTGRGGTYNFGTAYELTPSSIRPGASAPH